jgi:mitochondrial fission protein ELM1
LGKVLTAQQKNLEWQSHTAITAAWLGARMNAFAYHDPKKMPALAVLLGTKQEAKGIDEAAIKAQLMAYQKKRGT